MLHKHKRTGDLYQVLLHSFGVERQKHSVVYLSLKNGQIFNRDYDKFEQNFEIVSDPQDDIVPKTPHD